jgi:hypothetical protein
VDLELGDDRCRNRGAAAGARRAGRSRNLRRLMLAITTASSGFGAG